MKGSLFLLIPIYLTFTVSCGQVENRNEDTSRPGQTKAMNTASLIEQNRVLIKELARFEWNKPEGLSMITTGQPLTSVLSNEKEASPEAVIAPYRFRISESGNEIVILSNDPQYTSDPSSSIDFLVYDIAKKQVHRTNVRMADDRVDKSEIVDFILGEHQKLYLLERLLTKEKTRIDRLRYVEAGGKLIWQTDPGSVSENSGQKELVFGKSTALLKEMNGNVFVQTETSARTSIFKIDSKTFQTEEWVSLDNLAPKVFIDDDLNVHYVTFIKEANNRAYVSYDPVNEKKEIRYAGPEAYGLLTFPAALDDHNNIYSAAGLSFSCLSPELSLKWTFSVNNILPDSGRLLTSHFDEASKTLVIHEWQANGRLAQTIKVPFDLAGLRLGRLSGLVSSGDFVIETYQQENKTLWKYNIESKTLDRLPEGSQVNQSHLQAAATWQVDKKGNLYLAVSSVEGFHIVEVSIARDK